MKGELESFINDNIEAFNSRTPDAAVLERIREQLKQTDRKKKEKAPVISLGLRWAVAACLILLAGGVAFLAINKTEVAPTVAVTTKKETPVKQEPITIEPNTAQVATTDRVAENAVSTSRTITIDQEAELLQKSLLFAKLNDKGSAGQRLEAASEVEMITSTDNDIVDALAKTMTSDPNTNVRLAALDALSKFYREPYVKKKLLSALPKQKDPMVQIALIELLTKMKENSILKQLNKMVSDEHTIQAVKDQAYTGILTLKS